MIRPIIQAPDDRLRAICEPMEWLKPIGTIFTDLLDTRQAHNCLGLAAPQIGVLRRVIAVSPRACGGFRIMVNPAIVERSAETDEAKEGCLSIDAGRPRYRIRRSLWVVVTFMTMDAKPHKIKAAGLTARILQHEIDHLDGKMIGP